MAFTVSAYAQQPKSAPVHFFVNAQKATSLAKTPYQEIAALAGIKSTYGNSIALGAAYRKHPQDVKTDGEYYGFKGEVLGQLQNTKFLVSLSTEYLYGEYWKKNEYQEYGKYKKFELTGSVGIGYLMTPDLMVFGQYAPYVYDPLAYTKRGEDPFKYHGFSVKVSYNFR